MVSFSNIYAIFPKQIHKMHKITSLEDGKIKILRPKFWSLGTNLGSHWARLAKGLPQIFCHDGFYIVLRVPYNPHRVPFMVDFLFTNIHSGHWCIHMLSPNLMSNIRLTRGDRQCTPYQGGYSLASNGLFFQRQKALRGPGSKHTYSVCNCSVCF